MTRQDEGKKRKNPFAKLLDDAGRMLEKSNELNFLDELPESNDQQASVPFPYGSQASKRHAWD